LTADPNKIKIRLVGKHPLWGHFLWNAGKVMADYLDNPQIVSGKRYIIYNRDLSLCRVLELGAGGALPSIVAHLQGASKVVITDYPDADLVENMTYNVKANTKDSAIESETVVVTVRKLLLCTQLLVGSFMGKRNRKVATVA
jgi:nicotinamide N-methyltransferase